MAQVKTMYKVTVFLQAGRHSYSFVCLSQPTQQQIVAALEAWIAHYRKSVEQHILECGADDVQAKLIGDQIRLLETMREMASLLQSGVVVVAGTVIGRISIEETPYVAI